MPMNEQHLDLVLAFINANGYQPRGQRKAAGVQQPPEKAELKLGAIVTRIRQGLELGCHTLALERPERRGAVRSAYPRAPNKQQHSATKAALTQFTNGRPWLPALESRRLHDCTRGAALFGFDEGAALKIVRISKLLSDRKCGQFYAELLEPAMMHAAKVWDAKRIADMNPYNESSLRTSSRVLKTTFRAASIPKRAVRMLNTSQDS